MMLSGGQRQRVAIAQQLLCSSHFLLMDEPFSGLDPLAKSAVCETLVDVSTTHELNTIIVVTHDIESAIRISDTLWLLGRNRDARGQPVGGASIQEIHDLAGMGLAWDPDIESRPRVPRTGGGAQGPLRDAVIPLPGIDASADFWPAHLRRAWRALGRPQCLVRLRR